jgi:arginine decarboxylase
MVGASIGLPSNGHSTVAAAVSAPGAPSEKPSKKKPAKRGGNGHGSSLPEVGQDELLGEQQPGDAVQAEAGS